MVPPEADDSALRCWYKRTEFAWPMTPPLIVPIEELAGDVDVDEIYRFIADLVLEYTRTLPVERAGWRSGSSSAD